jgi:hypothetical protein
MAHFVTYVEASVNTYYLHMKSAQTIAAEMLLHFGNPRVASPDNSEEWCLLGCYAVKTSNLSPDNSVSICEITDTRTCTGQAVEQWLWLLCYKPVGRSFGT